MSCDRAVTATGVVTDQSRPGYGGSYGQTPAAELSTAIRNRQTARSQNLRIRLQPTSPRVPNHRSQHLRRESEPEQKGTAMHQPHDRHEQKE